MVSQTRVTVRVKQWEMRKTQPQTLCPQSPFPILWPDSLQAFSACDIQHTEKFPMGQHWGLGEERTNLAGTPPTLILWLRGAPCPSAVVRRTRFLPEILLSAPAADFYAGNTQLVKARWWKRKKRKGKTRNLRPNKLIFTFGTLFPSSH